MPTLKVNEVIAYSGNTLTLGTSGNTVTIPAGVTFNTASASVSLPNNSVTNAQLQNSTVTINGTAVALGTSTNVGIVWTSTIVTSALTVSAGVGYFVNTSSAAITVTLPSTPSAGQQIALVDYAGTFATNNVTLGANGNKINGVVGNKALSTNREGVTITYVDSTQGWVASSGVNSGSQALDPVPYSIDYLVVAGGGGGGSYDGGGGGAGGYRSGTYSNVAIGTAITVTIGDGGAGGSGTSGSGASGSTGSNSSISGSGLTTITSAGDRDWETFE